MPMNSTSLGNDFENKILLLPEFNRYKSIFGLLTTLCVNIDVASNKEAKDEIFPSSEVKCAEKSLAA